MSGFRAAVATALAAVTLIAAVPASADERDRHGGHERYHRAPPPRQAWGYGQPSYVEAPPPVVYAPPAGPAFLSFGITLPIR